MHPVGRMGEYLVQEAPVSHTLLGQPGELTREGLESRDKTHTLVPSLQGQGDLRSKGSESVGLFIQPIPRWVDEGMQGRQGFLQRNDHHQKVRPRHHGGFTVQNSWQPGP